MDLDIKIKDGKFNFALFDERDSSPFFKVRIPDKSGNIPYSIFYSTIGAESLRSARAGRKTKLLMIMLTSICKKVVKIYLDWYGCPIT